MEKKRERGSGEVNGVAKLNVELKIHALAGGGAAGGLLTIQVGRSTGGMKNAGFRSGALSKEKG